MQYQTFFQKSDWWTNANSADTTIVASTHIPVGISSLPFVSKISLRKLFSNLTPTFFLKAFVSEAGVLSIKEHLNWVPLLQIAQNCFEQNTVAQLSHNGNAIVIQTIKVIQPGEELKVWLSAELLTQLDIPFLSPLNIVSHRNYKCHQCNCLFSQPNPLKVHLAFDCGAALVYKSQLSSDAIHPTHFLPSSSINALYEGSKRHSSTATITKEPRTHPCTYCGKLYTRKYGLKIHLRTHTGHKPLECRHCGRAFSDPSNLNKHVRLHVPQNSNVVVSPYRCKICSKVLVRRRDLDRHLKARHQAH